MPTTPAAFYLLKERPGPCHFPFLMHPLGNRCSLECIGSFLTVFAINSGKESDNASWTYIHAMVGRTTLNKCDHLEHVTGGKGAHEAIRAGCSCLSRSWRRSQGPQAKQQAPPEAKGTKGPQPPVYQEEIHQAEGFRQRSAGSSSSSSRRRSGS